MIIVAHINCCILVKKEKTARFVGNFINDEQILCNVIVFVVQWNFPSSDPIWWVSFDSKFVEKIFTVSKLLQKHYSLSIFNPSKLKTLMTMQVIRMTNCLFVVWEISAKSSLCCICILFNCDTTSTKLWVGIALDVSSISTMGMISVLQVPAKAATLQVAEKMTVNVTSYFNKLKATADETSTNFLRSSEISYSNSSYKSCCRYSRSIWSWKFERYT